ncbi:MAG: hypothetical protein WAN10_03420 [Candidatus Acidiferrales bacterium]
MKCKRRFYARRVPWQFRRHAHCPRCGNLDLQHIAKDWVQEGALRWLFRLLDAPAYRCDPCRLRFFSLRRLYDARAHGTETVAD